MSAVAAYAMFGCRGVKPTPIPVTSGDRGDRGCLRTLTSCYPPVLHHATFVASSILTMKRMVPVFYIHRVGGNKVARVKRAVVYQCYEGDGARTEYRRKT